MKKIVALIVFVAGISLFFGACSKSESYADKVKNERKLINGFIADHNIVVLDKYPANGVFKSNEFYLDASGVYIHVVDSGNGKRANTDNRADVYCRFRQTMTLPTATSDTVSSTDFAYPQYLQFKYGVQSTYKTTQSTYAYSYLSPGITIPLRYVGEGAIVKLIVPFNTATGSTYQSTTYRTIYYGELEYTRIIN
ncbi:MAG: hypothetical protein RL662_2163 [Bacteroidota bacterium]|jgi:hypothetical protein